MKLINAQTISDYIKREINPYGRPFEGTVYEFGLKLMKYLENAIQIVKDGGVKC